MADLTPGMWLGDWVLEDPIGEGGFAVVHRGQHSETKQRVALKVLTDARLAERLRSERASLALEHPRIVRTLEDGLDHDPPYLVLELLEGGDLRRQPFPLSLERSLSVVRDVADALDHAHDHGVLHLDVKPENVLLDGEGRAHLTDFGAVGGSEDESLRQSLALSQELGVAGTPDYAAPEVRYGDDSLDRRADVYSLAVLAFELLTGRLPLGLDRPSELVPSLPSAVDGVLTRALSREPKRRTLSASAFAGELAAALRPSSRLDANPDAPRGGQADGRRDRDAAAVEPESAPPPPKARRQIGAAAGLALAMGLLGGAALLWADQRTETRRQTEPRLAELTQNVPPQERIGVLLPVEDLGAPARGWARSGRALSSRFPPERIAFDLWTPAGLAELYDRGERNALASSSSCTLALHTVVPRRARALEDDALFFLLDLSSYEIRAASKATDPLALEVAAFVDTAISARDAAPLVVAPTIDAKLRVSNVATAEFDAQLTAALVARLSAEGRGGPPVRARAGLVPRLRAFNGDVTRALSATLVVACEYDHDAGTLAVSVQHTDGAPVGRRAWPLKAPLADYDPIRDAALFSVDSAALALLVHEAPEAVIDAALEKARAHLYQHESEAAAALITALLARSDVQGPARCAPLLLLATAHLDGGEISKALSTFDQAVSADPQSAAAQDAYARACLAEAKRLYDLGKGPWYRNDDEHRFAAANSLLARLDGLELVGEALSAEIADLKQLLDREL